MSRTAVYGETLYGTEVYGYFIPPAFRVDPFIAAPSSYSQITVSWNKPSGTIQAFRLIKNMYGFPVDQDDGEILLDITSGYPGSTYTDNNTTAGAYHYYGFYVCTDLAADEWVRSGLTGCLMITDYGSAATMQDLIPDFYIDAINSENELVADPAGNTYLSKFMSVLGWGFDYLRTQYDTYLNINGPWQVPLNALYNMAAQFNISINPDIHPYTLRKAVYYNATVNQLRGTIPGISTELSALTGWNADITIGPNIMLDNDQSYFADPFYEVWSSDITYDVGERVTHGNYFYECISSANYGNAPTGTSSSNTWWEAVTDVHDNTVLLNSVTGNISTWETLYPLLENGIYSFTPVMTLVQFNQGASIVDNTVSFNSVTSEGSMIVLMVMSTGGITVSNVSFAGVNMTEVNSSNDTSINEEIPGTDYWYVFYLPSSYSSQAFTLTTDGTGEIYGYMYELSNMGSPVTITTGASSAYTSVYETSQETSENSFWIFGMMNNGFNSASGSDWEFADAGDYGVGGYLTGSGFTYASVTFTGEHICAGGIAAFTPGDVPLSYAFDYEVIGVPDPLDTSDFAFNAIGLQNISGATTDLAMRTLSRTLTDLDTVTTTFAPDKYQAVADGIPVPYAGFNQEWDSEIEYSPGDIVLYSNQPFLALRASQGLVPPYSSPGSSTADWVPLSFDQRFRIAVSAYETASSDVAVYPFAEWYDANGNFIMRLIARNPDAGSVEIPNQLAFDSFTVGAGTTLSARTTNDGGNTWSQSLGSFSVSPYGTGCTYPVSSDRSIATVSTGNANAQVGLTFVTDPASSQTTGLVMRLSDPDNYLRADMSYLVQCEGGAYSVLGTYSEPCVAGDRLLVTLDGSTITCYRNNVQVLQVTSSFNETDSIFGIISETQFPAGDYTESYLANY